MLDVGSRNTIIQIEQHDLVFSLSWPKKEWETQVFKVDSRAL